MIKNVKKPFVSVIIPVFNGNKNILSELICSLRLQDYNNKEIIIVDDCSNQHTKNLLNNFKGVKVLTNEKNKGLASSLNKGILNSNGEYIVTILQDCVPYSKQWLSELVQLAEKKKLLQFVRE